MTRADSGRVTLRDVADHAGVSPTTVSFVLSGRRDMRISAATEERVLQSARVLGCRRSLVPRATPEPGSPVIGLVSATIGSESFTGEMIRGCIAAAAEHGHTVLMAESQGDPHLESAAIDSMLEHGVDRIRYGTTGGKKVHLPRALRGRVVVLMNCLDEASPLPAVLPDEYEAGRLVADTLLSVGHSDRIWLVGETPRESWAGRRRLAGTRARLRSAGLTIARHVECVWGPEVARNAVLDALRDQPMATAIVALNDRVAMDIYQAAAAHGLKIPDDLSVISFDNSDLARQLDPGLSSIALPHFDIGRRAVEILLDGRRPRPQGADQRFLAAVWADIERRNVRSHSVVVAWLSASTACRPRACQWPFDVDDASSVTTSAASSMRRDRRHWPLRKDGDECCAAPP